MKIAKRFLSLPVLLLFGFFSQSAAAGLMKYSYQTLVMQACCERTYDQEGNGSFDMFWLAEEQLSLYFIIPELKYDLSDGKVFYTAIENLDVTITESTYFFNPQAYNGLFTLETYFVGDELVQSWRLTFDVIDDSFPGDLVRRAAVVIDAEDYMLLQQDNYPIRRCASAYPPEWNMYCNDYVLDSTVAFRAWDHTYLPLDQYPGGLYRLYGEPLSVPEPFSPFLLFTGLAGIFFAHRMKFMN